MTTEYTITDQPYKWVLDELIEHHLMTEGVSVYHYDGIVFNMSTDYNAKEPNKIFVNEISYAIINEKPKRYITIYEGEVTFLDSVDGKYTGRPAALVCNPDMEHPMFKLVVEAIKAREGKN